MAKFDDEKELAGGNVNAGVVRVGDTVRRPVGPYSDNVHWLLDALEEAGFAQAPRFLGMDDKGREILSFIDGERELPTGLWQDEAALVAAAHMLRGFHEATRRLVGVRPDGWAYRDRDAGRCDVIGHNDFAPYNMIYRRGRPIGIVDFDLCGPAPHLRDLAYLCYWLAPLSFAAEDLAGLSEAQLAGGSGRLKLLCATYGEEDYEGLLAMVSEVLHHMGDEDATASMVGREAMLRLKRDGHLAHWQQEAAALDGKCAAILESLG